MKNVRLKSVKNSSNEQYVLDFMRGQIDLLYNANRLGTAQNYEKTLKCFAQFLRGRDVSFEDVNELLIGRFNAYLLGRGMVRNSVSFYMRVLRAVYNKAVKMKLAEQCFPFEDVYTGIDRTRKRAVTESVVAKLYKMQLPLGSNMALARDVFIFSYFTRGMAFVDVAYLKRENIKGGFISYSRRKTGQHLLIRVEPAIREIMERYTSSCRQYVFPIIYADNPRDAYRQYRQGLNIYNWYLKQLAQKLNIEDNLTSYVARHTWATTARKHNIPISIISAGMGHTTEQTTRIYLDNLENGFIDDANKEMLEGVLGVLQ